MSRPLFLPFQAFVSFFLEGGGERQWNINRLFHDNFMSRAVERDKVEAYGQGDAGRSGADTLAFNRLSAECINSCFYGLFRFHHSAAYGAVDSSRSLPDPDIAVRIAVFVEVEIPFYVPHLPLFGVLRADTESFFGLKAFFIKEIVVFIPSVGGDLVAYQFFSPTFEREGSIAAVGIRIICIADAIAFTVIAGNVCLFGMLIFYFPDRNASFLIKQDFYFVFCDRILFGVDIQPLGDVEYVPAVSHRILIIDDSYSLPFVGGFVSLS